MTLTRQQLIDMKHLADCAGGDLDKFEITAAAMQELLALALYALDMQPRPLGEIEESQAIILDEPAFYIAHMHLDGAWRTHSSHVCLPLEMPAIPLSALPKVPS